MPQWPQDALCSLNGKMHGIGGDGLAFQAARKRRPLLSTWSHNDKTKWKKAHCLENGIRWRSAPFVQSVYDNSTSRLTGPLVWTLGSCSQWQRTIMSCIIVLSVTRILILSVAEPLARSCSLSLFFLCKIRCCLKKSKVSTSHHHSNNYSSISSLSFPGCACSWINNIILLCQSVSHLNTSQREKQWGRDFPDSYLRSAVTHINERFVVWLLSVATEEDDCDSPYFSHRSPAAGRINGKAADDGTRQPSWVKDDSDLFARCRLIKHQNECLMDSADAIMHRIFYAVLTKPYLRWSWAEPVAGLHLRRLVAYFPVHFMSYLCLWCLGLTL